MMLPLPVSLALRELRHQWLAAACFIAALVGMLAPLLILLALKNGVIGAMVDSLVEDPANREIIAMGTETYDKSFFADMAARPDVGFVMPATRRINATANALRNPATRALEQAVPLIPSAPGDPLVPGDLPVSEGQVWLSAELASVLGASAGGRIEMLINREVDGVRETARLPLSVLGVLPEENYARKAMFLSLPDLLAVESFRDDVSRQSDTLDRGTPMPERFASFRLYARDLGDLRSVMAELQARRVLARPRAENASLLLSFRDNLNILYAFIAVIAILGFWSAMAANLRGMVQRQRVSLSLLRLLSMSRWGCAQMPLIQSLVLVGLGVGATLLLVLPVLVALNVAFQMPSGSPVARLGFVDLIWTGALGIVTAVTAAIWAMRAAAEIKSDEVLHHG